MPGRPSHIDHIGIAVFRLDDAIPFWRDILGIPLHDIEIVEDQLVRTAVFVAGPNRIELLEATSPESPIARFLAKRGEGIHHLALATGDVGGTLDSLRAAGCRLVDDAPRPGAGGASIAFVHPGSTHGVLLEFCSR